MVGFQPRGRKDFSTPDGWRLKRNPRVLWGPCPLWTGDTLSVLVLRHVSDSDSFRYQAFVLVSVTNPSVVVLGKCNESLCLFVRISEIANKRLMVQINALPMNLSNYPTCHIFLWNTNLFAYMHVWRRRRAENVKNLEDTLNIANGATSSKYSQFPM